MGFNDIIDAIHKYGIVTTVCGVVIIGIYYILVKSTLFTTSITKISDSILEKFMKKKTDTSVKSITESNITNHDIFNYIDFWMHSKIPTIQFSTEYRTAAFRKYLIIFLRNHKDNIKTFILNRSFESMDDSQLWTSLLSLINNTIYDYEKEMESAGIPRIIIEKMKSKNNDTISLTIDLIEGVCSSHFYTSEKNRLKIYSILNIMLSILENIISNSDHICNSINGSLKGMKFNDNGRILTEL